MLRSVPAEIGKAPKDTNRLEYITSNSLAASIAGGVLAIGISSVFIFLLTHWNSSTSFNGNTLFICIVLILCEAFFEIVCSVIRGFIEGQGRFKVARSIDTTGRILWGISAITILLNSGGLVELATATALISLSRLSAYFYSSRRIAQPLTISMRVVNRAGVFAMMKGGIQFNGLKVLSSIYSQMDRSIIAIFLTVTAITTYDISFRFFSVTVLLLATASSAVIPLIASQHSRGNFEANREVLLKGTSITVAIMIPICTGLFLYAPSIIEVWIGPGYSTAVAPARIFLLFPMLSSANQIGIAMLTAVGLSKKVLKYQLVSVVINLVLSVTFVQFFGLKGVVLGTLISNSILWIPYTKIIVATFHTSLSEWAKIIFFPALAAIVTQVIFFVGSQYFFNLQHNYNVLFCGTTTLIALTCSFLVVRNQFFVRV